MLLDRAAAQSTGTHQPNLLSIFLVALICLLVLCNAACNQSLQAGAPSPEARLMNGLHLLPIDPPGTPKWPALARIEVTPGSGAVASGGTMQFTATVRESANSAVIWSVSAGTISPTGMFTAPQVNNPQTVLVTAVSAADSGARAAAFVEVSPALSTPLAITSSSLPEATTGVPFSASLNATGGTPPYTWSVVAGALPGGFQLNSGNGAISGTTSQPGTFSFTAQVADAAHATSSAASSVLITPTNSGGNFDGPAELPRVYLQSSLADTPATGTTIQVAAGGDLQDALNAANCGDTIALAAGATFTGLFQVPAKPCDDQHWIIVRTSSPDGSLPAEGTRLTPCYAGVASLPGRPDFQCTSTQNVMSKIVFAGKASSGPLLFAQGANHYRFVGLEITRANPEARYRNLIETAGVNVQADHLVFDRMWIHGTASDETKGGIHVSGMSAVSMVDSYFSDFHCIAIHGQCQDSQAINGGTGDTLDGPFKIVNNFLEAAGESIMLGGGAGSASPADIEIRHNHLFKPLIWKSGEPGFVGAYTGDPYIVKNNVELKNAQRVLLEGNILENTWGGFTQHGFSVMITPSNQGGNCPKCRVTDITFRYNKISHVGGGFGIATVLGNIAIPPAAEGTRFSIHDVIIDDVNRTRFNGSGTLFLLMNAWPSNGLGSVTINHVTGIPDSRVLALFDSTTVPKMGPLVFTNNLVGPSGEPIVSAGGGPTSCAIRELLPEVELSTCFVSYVFANNAIVGVGASFPPSRWPAGNNFPPAFSDVRFTNFNDGIGGNYELLSSSPYTNAGSDGKNIGADVAGVESAISGAN